MMSPGTWIWRATLLVGSAMLLLSCTTPRPPKPAGEWNEIVLATVKKMPEGGGYSTRRKAFENLRNKAIVLSPDLNRLIINPRAGTPSFCSSACYLVLLQSLQKWEGRHSDQKFSSELWRYLAIQDPHPDGMAGWGRANANGPGFAKWVYDVDAGTNFSELEYAMPGDYLKIFWTKEIGALEYGHFVIYLGRRIDKEGQQWIRFWSSNMDGGFGVKEVPMSTIARMLFTRVEEPGRFEKSRRLPYYDAWLYSLLEVSVSQREMNRKVGL